MNIEIHNPELEQRVREQILSGQFRDVDGLFEKALDALAERAPTTTPPMMPERPVGRKSLVELFADSPLKGLYLDFSRNKSGARPVDLA